jgi:hypothetical protein
MWAKLKSIPGIEVVGSIAQVFVTGWVGWQANEIAKISRLKVEMDTLTEYLRLQQDLNIGNASRESRQVDLDAAKLMLYEHLLKHCMKDAYEQYEQFNEGSKDKNGKWAKQLRKTHEEDKKEKLKLDRELKSGWWWWWSQGR